MIEDLLDHKCDIYHVQAAEELQNYGLPSSTKYTYGDKPDVVALDCHFGVKTSSITIVQQQPYNSMDARMKLTLPIGADIRLNDKIVDCDSGLEYTAGQPRNIRNHHKIVYIQRIERQKPL